MKIGGVKQFHEGSPLREVDPLDTDAPFCVGINVKQHRVQLAGAGGGLEPAGKAAQKAVDGLLRLDADDRLAGAGHAQVGDKAQAAGDIFTSCPLAF